MNSELQESGELVAALPIGASSTRNGPVLISRDEMNLAEFPLTVLSTRSNPKLKTLEFHDTIRGKSGEVVDRHWIITGADRFGLPTASDDEVLLGLLKLTVDDGFRDRKVFFTRYELLRILRWTTEGRSYVRLQKALDRLSGVRIKATNAFYDNESKSHSTRNFGILDGYEINDGRSLEPKPSFFTWSDVLFKSFQVGFIKKLDFDYYLGLKSAVSKRLYRYLDKHFWYKSKVQINLFTLAHEKIGISRNYAFASSLKQQLDPAIEELVARGFLAGCDFIGKGKDTEVVLYAGSGKPRIDNKKDRSAEVHVEAATELVCDSLDEEIVQALVTRGIMPPQATKLASGRTPSELQRMKEIIAYFDEFKNSNQGRKMTSPVGFLYRAVEKPFEFKIPGAKNTVATQSSLAFAVKKQSSVARADNEESLRARYLEERMRMLREIKAGVEPELLAGMQREVETGLSKIRNIISKNRFDQVVSQGVDDKLAKLFAVPDFEAWVKKSRR
jgi:hypothetical protein